jgi:uroporphyrinogen-III synthase
MPDMKPNLPLSEWTVLSLRPYGQHAVAHCASKLRGANFLSCSSMKFEAIKNDDELKKVLACDYIIVTSPAAARFAGQSPVFSWTKNSQWFAVGEGTASVLRKIGVQDIDTPEADSNSENLLAMPALQELRGHSVGLMTAPGGRGLIEPELVRRGALVHVAHLYRREIIPVSAEQLEGIDKLHPPFAVLCSSYEIFQSFWQQITPALQAKLQQGFWIVSSARLQVLLQKAGILHTAISPSPQPELMVAHLEHVQTQQVR